MKSCHHNHLIKEKLGQTERNIEEGRKIDDRSVTELHTMVGGRGRAENFFGFPSFLYKCAVCRGRGAIIEFNPNINKTNIVTREFFFLLVNQIKIFLLKTYICT